MGTEAVMAYLKTLFLYIFGSDEQKLQDTDCTNRDAVMPKFKRGKAGMNSTANRQNSK
jgi:hypothetical protein